MDINQHWYRATFTWLTFLLLPFSWLFRAIVFTRHALYKAGIKKIQHLSVPVIIVGNITVGGTGKTPFVIWLVNFLISQGYKPGIVSRGYGGKNRQEPLSVSTNSLPEIVGDEAILLAKHANCPVIINPSRLKAAKMLLQEFGCDIIVSDDGLQHYQLGRNIEIAVIDGLRRLGNKNLLPAGPLREPISRLKRVDFIVSQNPAPNEYEVKVEGLELVSLQDEKHKEPLNYFKNKTVHAVAAIGNPEKFFSSLRAAGIDVIAHPFSDHYFFQKKDLEFGDDLPVLMTEKDAVKCKDFPGVNYWYLPVIVSMSPHFEKNLRAAIAFPLEVNV